MRSPTNIPFQLSRAMVALLALVALVMFTADGQIAQAATITVNTTFDELNADGDCSLREAIQAANTDAAVDNCTAGSGADTITVPAGTYTLSIAGVGEDLNATGDLDITDDLTITGAGAATTTIDAQGLDPGDRVLDVLTGGSLTLNGVTIANGSTIGSGGGIQNEETLVLNASVIDGNMADHGGGISQFQATQLVIIDSTISNNVAAAQGGGIKDQSSPVTIINSTISGNSATNLGGGISQAGTGPITTLTLNNVTVTDNTSVSGQGGGVSRVVLGGSTSIMNSIVAGNTAPVGPDCTGVPFLSQGYNLIGDTTGCTFTSTTGDLLNVDPLLGTLQDNGGPTLTHLIPVTSPAADAGNPQPPGSGGNSCDTNDQRGEARPTDSDSDGFARCDIGAFEATGAAEVVCPVLDLPQPDPGCTRHTFTASLTVELPNIIAALSTGERESSAVILDCLSDGASVNTRSDVSDSDTNGFDDMEIEIFFLDGYINCPGPIALGAAQASLGFVEEQKNHTMGTLEYPADLTADVCLKIDTPTTLFGIVENCPQFLDPLDREPAALECTIAVDRSVACIITGEPRFFDESEVAQAKILEGTLDFAVIVPGVGGVAELPDAAASSAEASSSSGPSAILIAAIAVVAIALGGAAWYARRRWGM